MEWIFVQKKVSTHCPPFYPPCSFFSAGNVRFREPLLRRQWVLLTHLFSGNAFLCLYSDFLSHANSDLRSPFYLPLSPKLLNFEFSVTFSLMPVYSHRTNPKHSTNFGTLSLSTRTWPWLLFDLKNVKKRVPRHPCQNWVPFSCSNIIFQNNFGTVFWFGIFVDYYVTSKFWTTFYDYRLLFSNNDEFDSLDIHILAFYNFFFLSPNFGSFFSHFLYFRFVS